PRAGAGQRATRRNGAVSIGPGKDFSSVSPPGSSSTRIVCPGCPERASGRTAHAESSSCRKEYSCSIFFSVASEGCSDEGASTRTDGNPRSLGCSARDRTNSSSLRRGVRTYCDRFTATPVRSWLRSPLSLRQDGPGRNYMLNTALHSRLHSRHRYHFTHLDRGAGRAMMGMFHQQVGGGAL